ncbi:uncharacterized protein LOC133283989 [Gastrolobium bilobum]|uniref:uncharacterized protein LOC133283989 n=1 Tax=Gastrolobium bilobum TaxID=150636 RepID=UPI002AB1790A|nr:uncharacterized protein LOC133283989 [Gastrolobium bilobum]
MLAKQKLLSKKFDSFNEKFEKLQVSKVQSTSVVCEYCREAHESNECPTLMGDNPLQVQVNGVWRGQGGGLDYGSNNYLQPPPLPQKDSSELEKALIQLSKTMNDHILTKNSFINEARAHNKNRDASIKNLEVQIGQLFKQISERLPGTFPSDTIANPKEYYKAIMTRSGKVLPSPEVEEKLDEAEKEKEKEQNVIVKKKHEMSSGYVRAMAPYPERFKQDAQEQQYARFLDIFKKLHINIPFAEALANMPNYAKFMKDLLSRKHKLQECQTVTLTEESLCDLGASVNLMHLSVCKSLGISELKPTMVFLQLADKSLRKPTGIIEDVLVKVDKIDVLEEVVKEEKSSSQELDEELKVRDIVLFEEEKSVVFEVLEKKDSDKEGGAPKVELKELPKTLKYILLGDEET